MSVYYNVLLKVQDEFEMLSIPSCDIVWLSLQGWVYRHLLLDPRNMVLSSNEAPLEPETLTGMMGMGGYCTGGPRLPF